VARGLAIDFVWAPLSAPILDGEHDAYSDSGRRSSRSAWGVPYFRFQQCVTFPTHHLISLNLEDLVTRELTTDADRDHRVTVDSQQY
jgi:hypothetical protein